jgi:hypothetical protein
VSTKHLRVLALQNPNVTFRGRFHRRDAHDCPGIRAKEEAHDGDDYLLVDVADLMPWQRACQFETCFQGLETAEAVRARYPVSAQSRPPQSVHADEPPPTGIHVGQTVVVRDVASRETKRRRIVPRGGDRSKDSIAADSPVARGLLGRAVGDSVVVELPRRTLRLEILEVLEEGGQGPGG